MSIQFKIPFRLTHPCSSFDYYTQIYLSCLLVLKSMKATKYTSYKVTSWNKIVGRKYTNNLFENKVMASIEWFKNKWLNLVVQVVSNY
jgi:hypothetical protein